jgi:tetratricopeptide (TPR) repeat protein
MTGTESYLEQAMREMTAENHAQALNLFNQAIAAKIELPQSYYWKANALLKLDRKKDAIESLDALLALAPDHKKAHLLRAQILSVSESVEELVKKARQLMDKNQFTESLDFLNRAKALRQPYRDLDTMRAVCFAKLRDEGSERQALYEELRYFPDNTQARDLLGQLDRTGSQKFGGTFDEKEFQDLLKIIRPYTMLSEARLFSLFSMAKHICVQNIPGNFVECGVAAGGSSALLGYVISKYSKQPRFLYSFDSFEGMPKPGAHDTHGGLDAESTGWGTGTCSAPEDSVKQACQKAGVTARVVLVKGYFEQTLPKAKDFVGMISLLHMDGDWYESTKAILVSLYDQIVSDGYIQIDDYGFWDGCKKAVHEFEKSRGITFKISPIDGTGVWCPKPERFAVNELLRKTLVEEFIQDDPTRIGVQSQMSANERFQVYFALRQELAKKSTLLRTVEVGSFAGASLLLVNKALKRLSRKLDMFTVDPGAQPQFFQVLEQLKAEVRHFPLFSNQAAPQLKELFSKDGNWAEFIFIDGDHTYEGVRQDIIDYYPLLVSGGIMMFHDYLPALDDKNRDAILFHHGGKEPGIRQACQELMEDLYHCKVIELPLLFPQDPSQTQAHLPIISGVKSTIRAYRKE